MKIAILGATGWIGSHILTEALSRNHDVTAVVRDPSKISDKRAKVIELDINANPDYAALLANSDVVIASIGGRTAGNHSIVANTAQALLSALKNTDSKRLIWVGGAGSLETSPGVTLVDSPDFPEEYKAEAIAQGEALTVFRNTDTSVSWTFVSPAADIYPGGSEGPYRIGNDSFFVDDQGKSRISVTDYAKALIDEAETSAHPKQRMSIAY